MREISVTLLFGGIIPVHTCKSKSNTLYIKPCPEKRREKRKRKKDVLGT